MYKLAPFFPPVTEYNCVIRIADSVFIPFDLANKDYQQYLEWIAEGNQPLPADE